MGLGSTAKKVQVMAERAEQLYAQITELRDQIAELRETVERTGTRVDELHVRSEKQWLVVQAMAEQQGVDVDEILTEAAIEEVELADDDANGDTEVDADSDPTTDADDASDATPEAPDDGADRPA